MPTPPDLWHDAQHTGERIEHDVNQTEHSRGHRPLPPESQSSLVIDDGETPDPQRERGQVAVDDTRADDEHPAWCSPSGCLPVEVAQRLRDQLTEHLDAVP